MHHRSAPLATSLALSATLWATLCLQLTPLGAAGPLQHSPQDLDAILSERVQAAAQMGSEELWSAAQTLSSLVGDEMGAPFDAAVERALRAIEGGPGLGRGALLLVATRFLGDDPDLELCARALLPLIRSGDPELIAATAELIESSDLNLAQSEVRERVAKALITVAQDGDHTPSLRVACATAAHGVGLGKQIPKARRVLFDFLGSQDARLKAEGALALAHLGIVEDVPGVARELERLAALPGERGRLAEAYLKQVQIRRHKETELRRARNVASDLAAGGAVGSDLERLERLIQLVQDAHIDGADVTRSELIEAAADGMLRSMDRHSSYFSPEAFRKFELDLEAEYGGIGAYVGMDREDGLFTITRPIYSGPAYKAGLYTDDKIVRIGDWPTVGEPVNDVIKRLKGKPGTSVELYIWRRGMDAGLIERPTEDMAVVIERARITVPPVHAQMLPGGIGLVELTTFSRVASQELASAIETLEAQGMRGLILDLRGNTGGLLTEARNVGDLFLEKGVVVVRTKSRVSRPRSFSTIRDAIIPKDMPMVTLINRFSASASEIVAGALQDHGRSTLIGQRSFGKGSVQNLLRLPGEPDDEYADENGNHRYDDWETITKDHDGDGEFDHAPRIKLTIEQYLLPFGRSIHRKVDEQGNIVSPGGVEPDESVAPMRREAWRLVEMRKLQDTRALRDWAREKFAHNQEAFSQLALCDMDDPAAYAGFEGLYESLDTILSQDDVRFLLRIEVRRLVQDAQGHAFPLGDFQEDSQLQAAVRSILADLGSTPESFPAYERTFDKIGTDGLVMGRTSPLNLRSADLDEALALIAAAGGEDELITREKLRELTELIRSMKKN
jgi:C-terminal peptidase prc